LAVRRLAASVRRRRMRGKMVDVNRKIYRIDIVV